VILVLGVLLTIAILFSPSDGKPGIVAPEKPTPERKDLIERTFSREEAGDPHRRFGFEVISCQKRVYKYHGGVYVYLVGEVKNISEKPLDAKLQGIVREKGAVIATKWFYLEGTTNIVPGDTCAFEEGFVLENIDYPRAQNFTVDVKILGSWTRY